MRWKGSRKMRKVVDEFLHPFQCKSLFDTQFYMLPKEKDFAIAYTFNINQYEDLFLESVRKQNPQVKLSDFLWSLLHELGHRQTYDIIEEREDEFLNAKEDLQVLEDMGIDVDRDYFYLEDEVLATAWAVSFANRNKDFVLDLNRKLVNIAIEMERKNNWEELEIFRLTN